MGKDYYAILGISRDADDDTIKKAYRKLGKCPEMRLIYALNECTNMLYSFKMAS